MMKPFLFVIAVAMPLAGCNFFGAWDPAPRGTVWVQQDFVGGRQCEPDGGYDPPDTERLLEGAGIAVYDTFVEHHGVCAACGCPVYAATHYARIEDEDVRRARRLDFVESDGPPMGRSLRTPGR